MAATARFISIRVDADLRKRVERLAKRQDRKLSWIGRVAVEQWVRREERKQERSR